MELLHERCGGLDVHKDTVVACLRVAQGRTASRTVRTFATTTGALRELLAWLVSERVEVVAMESTGVYWKPVYNLLEEQVPVMLVNPKAVKQVPGRKTDVQDCVWLADLLAHGLLRASLIPPRVIRELRDLTRQRTQWVKERTQVGNRIGKLLEDANIKLGSVASDALGVSGRAMIEALVAGEDDPESLSDLARGRLRAKLPQLRAALEGLVTEHHRFLLGMLLDQLAEVEARLERVSARIEEVMAPFEPARRRLETIPGVAQLTAEAVLAEIGVDMSQFPSAAHLCSWAGICPGNHRSAGQQKTGKTTRGSRWLRRALTEAAWAASHSKGTYLAAQYARLARTRGKPRALVAVAHTLLTIIYHLLADGTEYRELGADWFDKCHAQRTAAYLKRRLESLGYEVTLHAA